MTTVTYSERKVAASLQMMFDSGLAIRVSEGGEDSDMIYITLASTNPPGSVTYLQLSCTDLTIFLSEVGKFVHLLPPLEET